MPKITKKPEAGIPVSIRLPADLHEAATLAAEADDRTLNSYAVKAIREKLERDKSDLDRTLGVFKAPRKL